MKRWASTALYLCIVVLIAGYIAIASLAFLGLAWFGWDQFLAHVSAP